MYIHFIYTNDKNGTKLNPYISMTDKNTFKMILKYNLEQVGENTFAVISEREKAPKSYNNIRDILRDFAVDWQNNYHYMNYDWLDITNWGIFFREYGKKYGLLREFRANGII